MMAPKAGPTGVKKNDMEENTEFSPKLIYGLCSWCGTGGSETAGALHLKYAENIRPFRVPCTGSIDPVYILRALIEGADGFAVSGCHPGDCHFDSGNYRARRRVAVLKSILGTFGLGPERVWLRWVGHGEGKRFADTVNEFNDHIQAMGPNPLAGRRDT